MHDLISAAYEARDTLLGRVYKCHLLKGELASDTKGRPCSPLSSNAVNFSTRGVIHQALGVQSDKFGRSQTNREICREMVKLFRSANDIPTELSLVEWNNRPQTTKEIVIQAFEKTIKLGETLTLLDTDYKNTVYYLRHARNLISGSHMGVPPTESLAYDKYIMRADPCSPGATIFSLNGALCNAIKWSPPDIPTHNGVLEQLHIALARSNRVKSIQVWSHEPERTNDDLIGALDNAIEFARMKNRQQIDTLKKCVNDFARAEKLVIDGWSKYHLGTDRHGLTTDIRALNCTNYSTTGALAFISGNDSSFSKIVVPKYTPMNLLTDIFRRANGIKCYIHQWEQEESKTLYDVLNAFTNAIEFTKELINSKEGPEKMSYDYIKQVFLDAHGFIEKGWSQGACSRNSSGSPINAMESVATRWSATGALCRAMGINTANNCIDDKMPQTAEKVFNIFRTVNGIDFISKWNDDEWRKPRDVKNALRMCVAYTDEKSSGPTLIDIKYYLRSSKKFIKNNPKTFIEDAVAWAIGGWHRNPRAYAETVNHYYNVNEARARRGSWKDFILECIDRSIEALDETEVIVGKGLTLSDVEQSPEKYNILFKTIKDMTTLVPDNSFYVNLTTAIRAQDLLSFVQSVGCTPPKLLTPDNESLSFVWTIDDNKHYLTIDETTLDAFTLVGRDRTQNIVVVTGDNNQIDYRVLSQWLQTAGICVPI